MAELKKQQDYLEQQRAKAKHDKVKDMINITKKKIGVSKGLVGLGDVGSMMLAMKASNLNSPSNRHQEEKKEEEQDMAPQSQQQNEG
jgi:hypothetical protein